MLSTVYRFTWISFLFWLIVWQTQAQEVRFSKPQRLPSKITHYKLLDKSSEGVLIYKWGEKYHLLEAFNPATLQLNWAKELRLPKKTQVLEIIPTADELLLLYTIRNKKEIVLEAKRMGYNQKLIGEQLVLNMSQEKYGTQSKKHEVIFSKNKKYIGVIQYDDNKDTTEGFKYWVLDRQLNKLLEGEKTFEEAITFMQFLMNDDGDIFLLTGKNKTNFFGRTGQFESLHITAVNRFSKSEKEIKIAKENLYLTDGKVAVDYLNEQLVITGFYSEKQTNSSYGYFYALIDPAKEIPLQTQFQAFETAFIQKVLEKSKVKNYLENLKLQEIILRSDGGALVIGEAVQISHQSENRFYNQYYDAWPSYESQQFNYEDIIALSINPNGKLHWYTILKKNQYSENDQAFYSSFSLVNIKQELHFIFNERIREDTNINDVVVNSKGEYEVTSLINMKEHKVFMAPRHGKQISFDEIIIPAFNNKNEFVLGIIKI